MRERIKDTAECKIWRVQCRDGSYRYYKAVDGRYQKELPYTLSLFNWAHSSAMNASARGLVFCYELKLSESRWVEYETDGVLNGQPMFEVLRSLKSVEPAEPRRVEMMMNLCMIISAMQQDGFVHRDLHSRNVLLNDTGRVSVIDYDLCAFVGGVDGLSAEKRLQQSFPCVFSAWGEFLEPFYDSQQLASLLVSLYLWENVSPAMPTGMTAVFPDYDTNRCVICASPTQDKIKGCCGCGAEWCKAVIHCFNSLWTWPLHLQRPEHRCADYTDRMLDFMLETGASERLRQRIAAACERARTLPALLFETIRTKGSEGEKWCNIIEKLSSDPPVAITSVLPKLQIHNRLPTVPGRVSQALDLTRMLILRDTAKLVLEFYLHRAVKTAKKQPLAWLCAAFGALDIISHLHFIMSEVQYSVEQVAAAVSYFAFMLFAKQSHNLFGAEWQQHFQRWTDWESFSIVSRLFCKQGQDRFILKSEVAALQKLEWPGLSMTHPLRLPEPLMGIMSHDRFDAAMVYAMLCYKGMFKEDLSAFQLVRAVQHKWNEHIYSDVVESGMNI